MSPLPPVPTSEDSCVACSVRHSEEEPLVECCVCEKNFLCKKHASNLEDGETCVACQSDQLCPSCRSSCVHCGESTCKRCLHKHFEICKLCWESDQQEALLSWKERQRKKGLFAPKKSIVKKAKKTKKNRKNVSFSLPSTKREGEPATKKVEEPLVWMCFTQRALDGYAELGRNLGINCSFTLPPDIPSMNVNFRELAERHAVALLEYATLTAEGSEGAAAMRLERMHLEEAQVTRARLHGLGISEGQLASLLQERLSLEKLYVALLCKTAQTRSEAVASEGSRVLEGLRTSLGAKMARFYASLGVPPQPDFEVLWEAVVDRTPKALMQRVAGSTPVKSHTAEGKYLVACTELGSHLDRRILLASGEDEEDAAKASELASEWAFRVLSGSHLEPQEEEALTERAYQGRVERAGGQGRSLAERMGGLQRSLLREYTQDPRKKWVRIYREDLLDAQQPAHVRDFLLALRPPQVLSEVEIPRGLFRQWLSSPEGGEKAVLVLQECPKVREQLLADYLLWMLDTGRVSSVCTHSEDGTSVPNSAYVGPRFSLGSAGRNLSRSLSSTLASSEGDRFLLVLPLTSPSSGGLLEWQLQRLLSFSLASRQVWEPERGTGAPYAVSSYLLSVEQATELLLHAWIRPAGSTFTAHLQVRGDSDARDPLSRTHFTTRHSLAFRGLFSCVEFSPAGGNADVAHLSDEGALRRLREFYFLDSAAVGNAPSSPHADRNYLLHARQFNRLLRRSLLHEVSDSTSFLVQLTQVTAEGGPLFRAGTGSAFTSSSLELVSASGKLGKEEEEGESASLLSPASKRRASKSPEKEDTDDPDLFFVREGKQEILEGEEEEGLSTPLKKRQLSHHHHHVDDEQRQLQHYLDYCVRSSWRKAPPEVADALVALAKRLVNLSVSCNGQNVTVEDPRVKERLWQLRFHGDRGALLGAVCRLLEHHFTLYPEDAKLNFLTQQLPPDALSLVLDSMLEWEGAHPLSSRPYLTEDPHSLLNLSLVDKSFHAATRNLALRFAQRQEREAPHITLATALVAALSEYTVSSREETDSDDEEDEEEEEEEETGKSVMAMVEMLSLRAVRNPKPLMEKPRPAADNEEPLAPGELGKVLDEDLEEFTVLFTGKGNASGVVSVLSYAPLVHWGQYKLPTAVDLDMPRPDEGESVAGFTADLSRLSPEDTGPTWGATRGLEDHVYMYTMRYREATALLVQIMEARRDLHAWSERQLEQQMKKKEASRLSDPPGLRKPKGAATEAYEKFLREEEDRKRKLRAWQLRRTRGGAFSEDEEVASFALRDRELWEDDLHLRLHLDAYTAGLRVLEWAKATAPTAHLPTERRYAQHWLVQLAAASHTGRADRFTVRSLEDSPSLEHTLNTLFPLLPSTPYHEWPKYTPTVTPYQVMYEPALADDHMFLGLLSSISPPTSTSMEGEEEENTTTRLIMELVGGPKEVDRLEQRQEDLEMSRVQPIEITMSQFRGLLFADYGGFREQMLHVVLGESISLKGERKPQDPAGFSLLPFPGSAPKRAEEEKGVTGVTSSFLQFLKGGVGLAEHEPWLVPAALARDITPEEAEREALLSLVEYGLQPEGEQRKLPLELSLLFDGREFDPSEQPRALESTRGGSQALLAAYLREGRAHTGRRQLSVLGSAYINRFNNPGDRDAYWRDLTAQKSSVARAFLVSLIMRGVSSLVRCSPRWEKVREELRASPSKLPSFEMSLILARGTVAYGAAVVNFWLWLLKRGYASRVDLYDAHDPTAPPSAALQWDAASRKYLYTTEAGSYRLDAYGELMESLPKEVDMLVALDKFTLGGENTEDADKKLGKAAGFAVARLDGKVLLEESEEAISRLPRQEARRAREEGAVDVRRFLALMEEREILPSVRKKAKGRWNPLLHLAAQEWLYTLGRSGMLGPVSTGSGEFQSINNGFDGTLDTIYYSSEIVRLRKLAKDAGLSPPMIDASSLRLSPDKPFVMPITLEMLGADWIHILQKGGTSFWQTLTLGLDLS